MKTVIAKSEHEVLYQELTELLQKHSGKLTAIEMLAIASNMLGKLVAMQDQRLYSPDRVMELVAENIQAGNQQALTELHRSAGKA